MSNLEWEQINSNGHDWFVLFGIDTSKFLCAIAKQWPREPQMPWCVFINTGHLHVDWTITNIKYYDLELAKQEVLSAYV